MTERPSSLAPRDALTSRDAACALGIALLTLSLYAATLQPDLGGPEDTPKFQFLGYVLGTPHPTGYPLYVMLSHVFVKLVPFGTIAYRANLFSAVMAALAAMVVFFAARLLGGRRWSAGCAALGLATGASFWRSAVFAEVYSLAAVAAALSVTLLLRWGATGRRVLLIAAIGATALASGNHLTIAGVVPAYVLYVLVVDRKVLTLRVLSAAVLLLALGAAQYGFIILRTRQNAPYLETRATSLAELVDVVTAKSYAPKRFAFSLSTVLTVKLEVVMATIGAELGAAGLMLFALGVAAASRHFRSAAWLVIGAAAGMLAMVLNLDGDVRGFITPVMVFIWPFTAVGSEALGQALASFSQRRRLAMVIAAAFAAAMPLVNLAVNYREADQSGDTGTGEFFRALEAQLPDGAAVVAEDYFYDMALHYLRFIERGLRSSPLVQLPFDPPTIRAAAAEQLGGERLPRPRPVFAFAGAATYLAVEGLHFVPITIAGPDLEEWFGKLPSGAVLVGATAYLPGPLELSKAGHPAARPVGRPQNFETFAVVVRRAGAKWNKHHQAVSVVVDADTLGAPLPPFGGTLRASADANGVRIEVGNRAVTAAPRGIALAVFDAGGGLLRTLEFPGEAPWRVPFQSAVYQLKGESPCVRVTTDAWADVTPVFRTGSAVTTLFQLGTVIVETIVTGVGALDTASAGIFGDVSATDRGLMPAGEGSVLWRSELTRTGGRRSVFRMAVDRPGIRARARLTSDLDPSVVLCAHQPAPFFRDGSDANAIRADFESEAYFGAGWSGSALAGVGRIRNGGARATLLLPLEAGYEYRLTLDISRLPGGGGTDVVINGTIAGSCMDNSTVLCTVELGAGKGAVSAVTLVTRATDAPNRGQSGVVFRGARIERRLVQ